MPAALWDHGSAITLIPRRSVSNTDKIKWKPMNKARAITGHQLIILGTLAAVFQIGSQL